MRSPGRAPERRTDFPLGAVPTTMMSARIPLGDSAVSPPARVTPNLSPRLIRLRAKRPTQAWGKSRGKASERKAATGSPPIAAISQTDPHGHRGRFNPRPECAARAGACLGCTASCASGYDSPAARNGVGVPTGQKRPKLAELPAAFVLAHDVVPDGGCRPDLRGHTIPRSELGVGLALEGL